MQIISVIFAYLTFAFFLAFLMWLPTHWDFWTLFAGYFTVMFSIQVSLNLSSMTGLIGSINAQLASLMNRK